MENPPKPLTRCRVLTMDGGPSPLLQIRLLREIERRCPGFLERTTLFAGTSDGSLMTLFLAAQLKRGKPADLIFKEAVHFANGVVHALDATCCGITRLVLGCAAMDRVAPFRSLLASEAAYGGIRMNELDRAAMVVTFDAFNWEPRYFRNFPPFCDRRTGEDARGPSLVSAALASSAFPLFLPIHYGPGKRHYVDGGLVANNPAMCALVSAAEFMRAQDDPGHHQTVRHWLGKISLLSLGATESAAERQATIRPPPDNLHDESNAPPLELKASKARMRIGSWPKGDIDWGWIQWLAVRPLFLINTMLQAPSNAVAQQCHDLLGRQHHRYGPAMGEIAAALRIMLAPPKKVIRELDNRARKITSGQHPDSLAFERTVEWVQANWMKDAVETT
jgi:hypothetical protein